MAGFTVGDTTVGSPLITPEIEKQFKEEEKLISEVTEETFEPIERTDEQNAAVEQVKNAIVLSDEDLILSYGTQESNSLMTLTNKTLSHVKASDVGDIGGLLSSLATQLTVSEEDAPKGIFGIFKKAKDHIKTLQIRYESAKENIDRVVATLENNQLTLIKNNKDLEQMKEGNRENFQRLSVYVDAGKLKIQEAYQSELPALEEKAKSGDQTSINELTEYKNSLNLFEKQIHDLDAQMSLSQAMAIQLETLTNTNRGLIQKINRSKTIMIPAWNMYMMAAFYNTQTEKALQADQYVTDATNQLLKDVTKSLHQTSKRSAEQSERAAIDITTLESMTSDIVNSLKDIDAAQAKGREYRERASLRIGELREELKTQLVTTINQTDVNG
ncbi:toxic anion resistance protein TelA [Streptococcus sp. AS14]|jgi:tellurite resistance protein|uniref:Toxic anion resistance protein n=1 Tax=Streptococcus sanguinis SK115 TaxID=888810 RepID=F0IBQ7_STRSA|nr:MULTISPECIES: toxic anion resistance protein [Streptococcus]EGD30751.1 toxic anion resistance protein [Streptococcus sanguinis SK115]EJO21990.1 toxic anion resistance protein TelA [Streptococcus sp. AS14]MBF1721427.1 toxic anion resistance protein [Streptococcus sp.]MBZ2053975.1 toxic anion resistance protein [Streptococcus sanguinis]MBZ2062904.1 toxic anion resistance protein [Streptococcus sanguinis]